MRVLVYSPVRIFGDCIATFLESAECVAAVLAEHDILCLDLKAIDLGADVALIDVTSPEAHSVPRLVKVVCPEVSTIAMGVSEVPTEVIACADSGFDAYVPRTARPAEVIATIHRVQRGEMVCDPQITRTLFNELARRRAADSPSTPDGHLTPREIEIARLIGRGAANKEIAAELHLSVATIKNHVHSVLRKLQVDNRAQIAMLLLENPLALRLP